jgi:hypothetical protein
MMFGYLMHREIGQSNPEENIKNVNGMKDLNDSCRKQITALHITLI